jgi:hypothetical protein
MARLTKAEREQLEALAAKAKAEDEEDNSYEVWVKNDKGHEVKLTGAKARKFMSQFGVDDDDDDEVEETEAETETEEVVDEEPAKPTGYFKKRGA